MTDFLLGLSGGEAARGRLTFLHGAPSELVLLAALAALAVGWLSYRRFTGRLPRWGRYLLAFLRAAALMLVFACVLGPRWSYPRRLDRKAVFAVLLDASDSMKRRDANYSPEQAAALCYAAGLTRSPSAAPPPSALSRLKELTRSELASAMLRRPPLSLLSALSREYDVKLYRFAGKLVPAKGGKDPSPGVTALGSALREVLAENAAAGLAGVLVVSDGRHNFGPHPVPAARYSASLGVPVFTVGLGGLLPPVDASLEPPDYKEVVFKGDELTISTAVRASGCEGRKTEVVLSKNGKRAASRTVTLPAAGETLLLSFKLKLDSPGEYRLALRLAPLEDEAVLENNERRFRVKVIEDKIRVLAVFGAPTWEYRYLKHALMRDSTMDCCVLLERPDGAWFYEGTRKPARFPADMEEMLAYDVVIMADPSLEGFVDADARKLIERFVGEGGGGFIYVCGEHNGLGALVGTPLERLLPVRLAPLPAGRRRTAPFRPVLTPEGQKHPVFRFASSDAENRRIWDSLPPLFWFYPVSGLKPGTEVLMVHPAEGPDGGYPLAVQARYGAGRVFFSAVDSTWRWRRRVGDRWFYRYWGQLIRFCAQERLLGGGRRLSVSTELPDYRPGDTVRLIARVLGRDLEPLDVPSIECAVVLPDGAERTVRLKRDDLRAGVFRGEFEAVAPGEYRVLLKRDGLETERGFTVTAASPESSALTQDRDLLEEIALVSGGEYLEPLPASLPALSGLAPPASLEMVHRNLLEAPLVYMLFALLLTLEWVFRRVFRLL